MEIEKDLPFFKATLINCESFYERTKVGKPDEFDYFVQLDNLFQDIRFEELEHGMVAVIPSESAFEKPRGGTSLQEPNGDVPLDGGAFSRLEGL